MWRFGATFSEQGAIAKHESGVRFRRELIKGFFSVLELGGDADTRRRAAALTPAQGRQLAPCSIVQVRTHMPSLIVLRMAPWSRSKRRARYSALDTARTVVRAHMHCSCGRAQVLHALHGMCDSAPSMTVLASLARDELVRQRSALDAAAADDMSENIDASSEEAPSSPLRHTRKKGRGDNDPAQSSPQEWRINSGSPAAFSPSLEPTELGAASWRHQSAHHCRRRRRGLLHPHDHRRRRSGRPQRPPAACRAVRAPADRHDHLPPRALLLSEREDRSAGTRGSHPPW